MKKHSEYDHVNNTLVQTKKKKRKKAFRIFRRILCIGLVLGFLLSDYSKVLTIHVKDNFFVSETEILESSGIEVNHTWFFVAFFEKIEESIEELPEVESVTLKWDSIHEITLEIDEYKKIGYQLNGSNVSLLSESGFLQEINSSEYNYQSLIQLKNFDQETLESFSEQFYQIPSYVRSLISDIEYSPLDGDESRVVFYMNDGRVLYLRIEDMVEQLDGDSYEKLLQIFPDNKYYDLVGKYSYVYD